MKKLLLFTSLILTNQVFAATAIFHCEGINGLNQKLQLFVANHTLYQVRVTTIKNHPSALLLSKMPDQSIEGITQYSLYKSPLILEIENKILDGENGKLSVGEDLFSCEKY